ncbi:hypothetical protein GCM10017556_50820 [Micromonospora sagamiensis]|nr:hypothetical protein GCM10017556_50820 [Micromonospora sagamiensis]
MLVIRLLSAEQARGADQSITIPSEWVGTLVGMPVTGVRDVSVFTFTSPLEWAAENQPCYSVRQIRSSSTLPCPPSSPPYEAACRIPHRLICRPSVDFRDRGHGRTGRRSHKITKAA